ncbi:hypothetical protein CEE44_03070 [Candidatus Woesearchaeota archaeon B3_Woes]|nr:MAG: hypothetical protein CEE44_03070 [Candidatus Woesearchaeota archaeon B3_Woes]
MKRGVKSVFITLSIILTIFITLSLLVNAAIFNNNLDTGLVSYWSFNGSANDDQGSNDGSVSGATLVNSCISGQAYSFDGSNDYINAGKDSSLPSTGVITVSAWINFTDSQHAAIAGRFIAQNSRTGNDSYIVNNTNLLAVFTDTGDIELKGDCKVLASCGSGIFEIYNSGIVASINSTGDLCLEAGDCTIDASCSAGSLKIKDGSGTVVSSINSSGSLCYTGNLIQRGFR